VKDARGVQGTLTSSDSKIFADHAVENSGSSEQHSMLPARLKAAIQQVFEKIWRLPEPK
jgi:hypothetical protein